MSNKQFYTILIATAVVALVANSPMPVIIYIIYFLLDLMYQAHINVMLKRDPNYLKNQAKKMDILGDQCKIKIQKNIKI